MVRRVRPCRREPTPRDDRAGRRPRRSPRSAVCRRVDSWLAASRAACAGATRGNDRHRDGPAGGGGSRPRLAPAAGGDRLAAAGDDRAGAGAPRDRRLAVDGHRLDPGRGHRRGHVRAVRPRPPQAGLVADQGRRGRLPRCRGGDHRDARDHRDRVHPVHRERHRYHQLLVDDARGAPGRRERPTRGRPRHRSGDGRASRRGSRPMSRASHRTSDRSRPSRSSGRS